KNGPGLLTGPSISQRRWMLRGRGNRTGGERHAVIGAQGHAVDALHDALLGRHLAYLEADDLVQPRDGKEIALFVDDVGAHHHIVLHGDLAAGTRRLVGAEAGHETHRTLAIL